MIRCYCCCHITAIMLISYRCTRSVRDPRSALISTQDLRSYASASELQASRSTFSTHVRSPINQLIRLAPSTSIYPYTLATMHGFRRSRGTRPDLPCPLSRVLYPFAPFATPDRLLSDPPSTMPRTIRIHYSYRQRSPYDHKAAVAAKAAIAAEAEQLTRLHRGGRAEHRTYLYGSGAISEPDLSLTSEFD